MPTLNKLEYLDETKGQIKDALNTNFNSGIAEEDTFRSYVSKISDIYTNWPKVEGEDTTLSLSPTKKGLMKLDLKGNTQQNGTPTPDTPIPVQVVSGDNSIKVEGKNLIDTSSTTTVKNENGATRNGYYCKVNQTGNYYIYISNALNDLFYGKSTDLNNASTKLGDAYIGNTISTIITLNADEYFVIWGANNPSSNNKIMVALSSTATTYTPYVSQTYPISLGNIELCKTGDYQDSIKKSTGKNLFDKNNINLINDYYVDSTGKIVEGNSNKFNWIKLQPNTTYTLSQPKKSLVTVRITLFDTQPQANTTGTILGTFATADGITQTFTTTNNGIYLGWVYCNTSNLGGYTEQEMLDSIMLNKGSTALPYEPYGKVWYLNKQIGKVVLDGSETTMYCTKESPGFRIKVPCSDNVFGYSNNNDIYCNIVKKFNNNWSIPFIIYVGQTYQFWIGLEFDDTFLETMTTTELIDTFKTYCSNHNVKIIYCATPTYTEITDTTLLSQLEALAYSYDEQTNISQVNDDLGFIISASALMKGGN